MRLRAFALISLLLAAGCAGKANGNLTGNTLVVARVKDAVTLDPAHAIDGMSLQVTAEIMKGLVQFKTGGFEVAPAIAKSWSVSRDGLTWTFRLKPGLQFSDGEPIDANAVKFNFDRWRFAENPYHGAEPYAYYASMFGGFPGLIEDVNAPDANTVVFTLTRPFAPFLQDLAMPSLAIGSPKAISEDAAAFADHPIGWGPYTLVDWQREDRITLRANPKYPARASYQTVVVKDIPDQASSVLEMQNGTVDILANPRTLDAIHLASDSTLSVFYQPAVDTAYVAMNMDRRPFENLEVRRAIALTVDVRAIAARYYPQGAIVAANWTPPGILGENNSLRPFARDLVRARALLAKAGLPHGFDTDLLYPTTPRAYLPEPRKVAEAIAADLAQAGVRVRLEPLDLGEFLRRVQRGEHGMCLIGFSSDNGDPDNFLYTLLDKDSANRPNAQNYSFWRNGRFHELMIAGQRTSDRTERARLYAEANALIHDQVPALPLVHVSTPIIIKSDIGGFVPSPDNVIPFETLKPKG